MKTLPSCLSVLNNCSPLMQALLVFLSVFVCTISLFLTDPRNRRSLLNFYQALLMNDEESLVELSNMNRLLIGTNSSVISLDSSPQILRSQVRSYLEKHVKFSDRNYTVYHNSDANHSIGQCNYINDTIHLFENYWTGSQLSQLLWDLDHNAKQMAIRNRELNVYRTVQQAQMDFERLETYTLRHTLNMPVPVDLSGHDQCCHMIGTDVTQFKNDRINHIVNDNNNNNNNLTTSITAPLPKLTVIINTWRRESCLLYSMRKWSQCESVDRIVVVSADPTTKQRWYKYKILYDLYVRGKIDTFGKDIYLHRKVLGSDKLTDRFKYDPNIMTDVVFPVDDDMLYLCHAVTNLLKLWSVINRDRSRNRIVLTSHPNMRPFTFQRYAPEMPLWRYFYENKLRDRCGYNGVFLTLGGILHKEYLIAYHNISDHRMRLIRQKVDEFVTGEDIAMSILYSSMHGGIPPYTVIQPNRSYRYLHKCKKRISNRMHANESNTHRMQIAQYSSRLLGFDNNNTHQSLYHTSFYLRITKYR